MPAVNKGVNVARGSAWPMQGGLQSITNTTTVRTNVPATTASHPYIEVPPKGAAIVPIVPDARDSAKKTQTPSPKKVTIQVEPASGKENVTATSQSTN